MSVPAYLKAGPFTSNVLVKKRYLLFYICQIWISIFIIQFEFWWYWNLLYYSKFIHFIIFLPAKFELDNKYTNPDLEYIKE